ncbi:MAG TPA: hypothetical protein VJJ80_01795 [Patescibacteria group bacterium]|nr:hypothetical protein [Patescibacteria group bacterium]
MSKTKLRGGEDNATGCEGNMQRMDDIAAGRISLPEKPLIDPEWRDIDSQTITNHLRRAERLARIRVQTTTRMPNAIGEDNQ